MKKVIIGLITLAAALSTACSAQFETEMDAQSATKVDSIIQQQVLPNRHLPFPQRLLAVSEPFLGTPYLENTLIGSPTESEKLVVNFNEVDCFTYLDYVLALTQSQDRQQFLQNLATVRYIDGQVTYYKRKHFFTDWFAEQPINAVEVTTAISEQAIAVTKYLNQKKDGGEFIPGLAVRERTIHYIPSDLVDQQVLDRLQEGDLVGIYSSIDGLDVSHVGLIVKKQGEVYYRNASSLAANRKVVDSLLSEYIKNKPGIVVVRVVQ